MTHPRVHRFAGRDDVKLAYRQMGDGRPLLLLHGFTGTALNSLVSTPDEALRQVDTPTLVAVGDQDHQNASADALAAVLPNARFTRVPGNHWSAFTAPQLATAIIRFLDVGSS